MEWIREFILEPLCFSVLIFLVIFHVSPRWLCMLTHYIVVLAISFTEFLFIRVQAIHLIWIFRFFTCFIILLNIREYFLGVKFPEYLNTYLIKLCLVACWIWISFILGGLFQWLFIQYKLFNLPTLIQILNFLRKLFLFCKMNIFILIFAAIFTNHFADVQLLSWTLCLDFAGFLDFYYLILRDFI